MQDHRDGGNRVSSNQCNRLALYSGEETLVVKSKGQEAGSRNQRDRSPRDRSIHISSVSQEKYDSAQVVATHRGVWEKRREAQYQAMLDVHEFL